MLKSLFRKQPPLDTGAALQQAVAFHQQGRLDDAEPLYLAILDAQPAHFDARHLFGVLRLQQGRSDEALALISKALTTNPNSPQALANAGMALQALGRHDEALASYDKAIALKPDFADAAFNRGNALNALGRLEEAVASYDQGIAINPRFAAAWANRGHALQRLNRHDDALHSLDAALALRPDDAQTLNRRGNALSQRNRHGEAIADYDRALEIDPAFADASSNRGNALHALGRDHEALAAYDRALGVAPDHTAALYNRAVVLHALDRRDEAIAAYATALAVKPDSAATHTGLGNVFQTLREYGEARACYLRALSLQPDHAEAHLNLGNVFDAEGEYAQAQDCYRAAVSLRPGYAEALWASAVSQLGLVYGPDAVRADVRSDFSRSLAELETRFTGDGVADGATTVGLLQPFFLAYHEEDNRDLLARYGRLCVRLMSAWYDGQGFSRPTRVPGPTLRVGIVSAHIYVHSVWTAILEGWFRHLDADRFSLHVFYTGAVEDQATDFARTRAAHFEAGGNGLRGWVEAILGQQLDAIIYPEIGMHPMTTKLASMRLAPVQAATWGHPETTGLPTIDYFLSAQDLEPTDADGNYTERLVVLPHLGCSCRPVAVGPLAPDLATLGIEPHIPLLLCPGTPYKYLPENDHLLVDIARGVGRCQLVFFTEACSHRSAQLQRRLEGKFAGAGMDLREHVVFVPWQSQAAFLGLMRRADVYLDTLGFSGFNTAMQAVECGLPIVTREGRFMRGRLASGILNRMGLTDLVGRSDGDYVRLAVKLALDGDFRQRARDRIEVARPILFDDVAPVRALEAFLLESASRC